MDRKEQIPFFIKLGNKQNMSALYERGEIYMQTFAYFKEIEIGQDGRGYPNENLLKYFNGEALNHNKFKIIANINHKKFEHIFSPEGGTISITIGSSEIDENTNVFSTSIVYPEIGKQTQIDLEEQNFAEDKDFAVVIFDIGTFKKRIIDALKMLSPLKIYGGKVSYFDPVNFGGNVGPFMKTQEYSYQREFRICAYFPNSEVRKFEIGSLRGVAFPPMDKNELHNHKFLLTKNNG